ncbi:stage III sporulation protein AA [Siminovitchia fortis]|uniref:Stage III sporulation protein AA n=1 Tax=Siminovitchia fortis TaxID=254758 RepID=A0A443J3P3_9BACI|nr:stage III sporulation protein AA [Siminovitchia fortis]RWR15094.1 stage III sporulation protein AA [Siminovitchia fortis]WHY82768.1 stage III sporulation protein AA [Siminovitchia fortis]
MENIIRILPTEISKLINVLPDETKDGIEEIRLRVNRQVEVTAREVTSCLPYLFTQSDAEQLISNLAGHSFYTLDEELRRGYITIEGGHRIGLAGKAILEEGRVKALRHLASFNIRVAREKIGAAERFIPFIYNGGWKHTMIIGPPQTGKTTLLRDLARIVSTGCPKNRIPAMKAGIVDERSEIAGCMHGIPQLQFGTRVDVLDACPKAEGMMMMIRALSPDVLIVDEIGRREDKEAIMEAVNAGITLMMTTHGNGLEEIIKRPLLREIIEQQVFQRFIELSRNDGPGTVVSIKDQNGQVVSAHV